MREREERERDLPEGLLDFPGEGGLPDFPGGLPGFPGLGAGPGNVIPESSTRHITTMPISMCSNFIMPCIQTLKFLNSLINTELVTIVTTHWIY